MGHSESNLKAASDFCDDCCMLVNNFHWKTAMIRIQPTFHSIIMRTKTANVAPSVTAITVFVGGD